MSSLWSSAPKPLQLWMRSRLTGKYLNKTLPLTFKTAQEIKELTGLTITHHDIKNFPQILRRFSAYQDTIYRGVFIDDDIYQHLMSHGHIMTHIYLAFTKNFHVATKFGNQIVLSVKCMRTFDISIHSQESEVILDKGISLSLLNVGMSHGIRLIELFVN